MGDESTVLTGDAGDASTGDESTVLTGDTTTGTDSDTGGSPPVDSDAGGSPPADSDAGADGSDVLPDTYADFVMPEGSTLDETALNEATPLFKELGLNQEQAQKLIDVYAKQIQAGSQVQADNFNQLKNDWLDQSTNDREFGGDGLEENIKIAQSAITKYGTPELKQMLKEHGMGNHPEIVRFMVRVGKTLKEDVPGSTGTVTSEAEDDVSILYPKTTI